MYRLYTAVPHSIPSRPNQAINSLSKHSTQVGGINLEPSQATTSKHWSLPSVRVGVRVRVVPVNLCTIREVNEARRPHTCSRPCSFEEKTGKFTKSRRTQNTPRNSQEPGDRDHLETACDETRPTRSPVLARFRRSRVCGNRPRPALAIGKNNECYTFKDRLIK